ncbi:hypothetical protein Sjap_007739 [Stephania japonica]|uniref:Uncharacterized protein n=1 Tax=Stephania japonica TaxID=461633 RepID=A0AAP0JQE4_9MAGN
MERWVVDDGGHGGVDAESEIWLRRFKRRPRRAPLGGPLLSQSRPRRGGEAGWFPSPLHSHSFLQGDRPERQTLWPAAGGPLQRVEAMEGGGGRGRRGETTVNGGETSSPLPG